MLRAVPRLPTFAAALLAVLLAFGQARASQRVLDRAVATVGSEILTLSQLEFEARVELVRRGGKDAALAAIPHEVLAKNLALAIDQRLAQGEAERLGVYEVDADELSRAVQELRENLLPLQLEQFLALNEVSQGELERLLRRDLQANKYLVSRAQLRAPVPDSEVDAFAAAHPAQAGAHPSRQVREAIRAELAQARNQQMVQEELRRLYARTKVRIVDPGFAGVDAPLRPDATRN